MLDVFRSRKHTGQRKEIDQSFLTALSPIEVMPSCSIADDIAALISAIPMQDSPFADCPMVHMARLMIVDDVRPRLGDLDPRSLKTRYLLFMADIDGHPAEFLDCLYEVGRVFVEQVWGRCLGYPHRPATASTPAGPLEGSLYFRRYILSCSFPPQLPFAGFPGLSVGDIKSAVDTQEKLLEWIAQSHQSGSLLQEEWKTFIAEVRGP